VIREFLHLLSDPAHLAFEVTTTLLIEGLGAALGWPIIKRLIRRHDRREHR